MIVAAAAGHLAVVRLLCARGANVNHVSWAGETALDVARAAGHARVAAVLQKNGGAVGPVALVDVLRHIPNARQIEDIDGGQGGSDDQR